VLSGARFVVTDSGGVQQECAHLGIPCAIHRLKTESHQGLGDNVILTEMDVARLEHFLQDVDSYRRTDIDDDAHPSRVVVDAIERLEV
jgi:UDP-N-acetylglucosamine 2-epimerase (non-hydrolysing)